MNLCVPLKYASEPAVTIKNIEVSTIEHAWKEGWITPNLPKVRTGKKVAVVGPGPAGLSAANQLNKAGHQMTEIIDTR